ncbi:MAG: hypothetical protein HY866_23415 [Chloroflexi bacterium]|nr:hypothetical protein [Chloroflexota bacterium]
MPESQSLTDFSLLWPPDPDRAASNSISRLSGSQAADLDLPALTEALSAVYGHSPRIRDILLALCSDPAVIHYRQDVLADLLAQPALAGRLADLLPHLFSLDSYGYAAPTDQSPLHEIVWRVGQLEAYVDCVQGLANVFSDGRPLNAAGLIRLRDLAAGIVGEAAFQRLSAELPEMVKKVRGIASITVGVNLDDRLRPVEATLLAVNNRKFRGPGSSVLHTIFGAEVRGETLDGIAPLHSATPGIGRPTVTRGIDLHDPMMYPLFRDLADVLKKISRPVAVALRRYMQVNIQVLSGIGVELAFYLGAVRLIERLRAAGLPVCQPEIAPAEDRLCEIEAAYNPTLALRLLDKNKARSLGGVVITNDLNFGPEGRIFVLTGPNQGGKTTYTQAVGLAQVLAQAGLFVPGSRARLSPVDGIYTHFPVEERPQAEAGRLGEEAQRLSEIFAQATRHSLILLNESLASTSPGEGLYLAQDIVRILRVLGARAIYATHLHDLAAGVDDLNTSTPGDSTVISVVALAVPQGGNGSIRQTYQIVPGPPLGRSYAQEIAARYGISYEQLAQQLRSRGVLDGEG